LKKLVAATVIINIANGFTLMLSGGAENC